MKTLAILGASGHGKVVADAALSTGLWQEVVFYDDAWPAKKKTAVQMSLAILKACLICIRSLRLLLL